MEEHIDPQLPFIAVDTSVWATDDVAQLYRLVLNRDVETREILDEMSRWDVRHLVGSFFHSSEFNETVGARLRARERPRDGAPSADLSRWAAQMMPLTDDGRRNVAAAHRSWSALYHTLAADAVFRGYLDDDSPLTEPNAFATLTAAARVEGQLEEASARSVIGWAILPDSPDAPASVEVWINGAFCCVGETRVFRRDVQDRFGGAGLAGFEIGIPEAMRDRSDRLDIELRAAVNGFVLGRASVASRPSQPDAIWEVREEIAQARRLLERLESRLPWVESTLSTPLADYTAYSRAWSDAGPPPTPSTVVVDVIFDITGATIRDISEAADAIARQSHKHFNLAIIASPTQANLAKDLRQRLEWSGQSTPSISVLDIEDSVARLQLTLNNAVGEVTLCLTPAVVLHRHALARMASRFAATPGLDAVYVDEDVLHADDADDMAQNRRRISPRLKPDFDADYLLQIPYVGELVAFRTAALRTLQLRPEAAPHAVCDALMRMSSVAVGHIGRVLASRVTPEIIDQAVWRDCVSHRLAQTGVDAVAERRNDILGAQTPALRIRRAAPAASACLIIPTRDGLDLLKPCIDSLLDRRADNATPFEILVIDHESREPATQAYLAALVAQGSARVLPYSGDFNWALMNNLAAAETTAEVLVFLNNDTVALSRDWMDELAAQAMRSDIGVVGCRLIYGDGAVQHAGFVNREETYAFLCHEGVGAAGSDPGYLDRHVVAHATAAVTGACMAIRADLFRDLGGFDPAFPVEGNDVELCLRARARGLTVLYTPDATLYHLESKTRGFNHDLARQAVAEAASRVIWRRWGERFSRDPGFNPHFDRTGRPFGRLRPPPPWSV
jgi:GT2 family glycosyltransferase